MYLDKRIVRREESRTDCTISTINSPCYVPLFYINILHSWTMLGVHLTSFILEVNDSLKKRKFKKIICILYFINLSVILNNWNSFTAINDKKNQFMRQCLYVVIEELITNNKNLNFMTQDFDWLVQTKIWINDQSPSKISLRTFKFQNTFITCLLAAIYFTGHLKQDRYNHKTKSENSNQETCASSWWTFKSWLRHSQLMRREQSVSVKLRFLDLFWDDMDFYHPCLKPRKLYICQRLADRLQVHLENKFYQY